MSELPHTRQKIDVEAQRIIDLEESGVRLLDLKKRLAEYGKEEALAASLARIDALTKTVESANPEELREKLVGTMEALEELGRSLPAEDPAWADVTKRYEQLLAMKQKSGTEVSRAFSEVFDQFNDFIEDEFVARAIKEIQEKKKGQGMNVGEVMKTVYGRTKEEIEDVKRRNRERVVETIEELKEKPYISFEDIGALHAANNRGVAPKAHSRMRLASENEEMVFGKAGRIGTFTEDLPTEIGAFEARVEDVIDRASVGALSSAQYEIAVANLHNELLDMHPFNDRNGSTALLFMELMQARRGYEPPKKREPNYYLAVSKALGYNPVAVAIVGYEQYKIGFEAGYFKGVTAAKKKKRYEMAVKVVKKLRAA